jgi:hypothetical protein
MIGASNIIAVVVVAMMVIIFGLMFWTYSLGYFSQTRDMGENATARNLDTITSCMRIEESFKRSFFIRNCGSGVMDNKTLNVYLDESPVGFTLSPSQVDAGKSGNLTLIPSVPEGQHLLKLSNPNVEAQIYFNVDSSLNFRIV